MGFSFIRTEKITNRSYLEKAFRHNYRLEETKNADEHLSAENKSYIMDSPKNYLEVFDEKMKDLGYGKDGKKMRENAVLALDVVCSFSKEELEGIDLERWNGNNVAFLQEYFDKSNLGVGNVIDAICHHDESSVHMHAIVIPINEDGELNYSRFLAKRQQFRELQDSYGDLMKKEHDLERGFPNSPVEHKDIRRFYRDLGLAINLDIPEKGEHETSANFEKRVVESLKDERARNLRDREAERNKHVREMHLLKEAHRNEIEKMETRISDLQNAFQEKTDAIERYQGYERVYGDIKTMAGKTKVFDRIELAVKELPERDRAISFQQEFNYMSEWGKKRQKEREKEKGI